ncbi:MAG: hydroxyacid dehydrogenase [Clostridia bacterium]|nr:hydroxyacid dehydrogenase [Clostridia bacterium]
MKLLLTGAFNYTEEQRNKIEKLGFEIDFLQFEKDEIANPEKYDAVVCNGLFLYHDVKKFTNLKFVQLTSVGMDRVPLDCIKEKGIEIHNARGVYSAPMAEWVILKILEIYKNSFVLYENQKNKKWIKERNLLELTDKNALIVGTGSVGNEIAKRLKAFDCNVTGLDICEIKSPYFDNIFLMDKLDEMLSKSDIVILTLPLTDETNHLFNKDKFSLMKDGNVLVNVSRGGVLNESHLIESLQNGKFRGVALDVFENEPLSDDSSLWNFDNVIITPHNSFVGDKVSERMFGVICRNLKGLILSE